MRQIVWLASYPKSGNTWTRIFLLNLFRDAQEPISANDVGKMSASDVSIDWYRLVDPGRNDDWSHAEIAGLRSAVQRKITEYTPDSIFVKTHCLLGSWHDVPLFDMSVTAGAIYIVRNPLDIVASYAHHSDLTRDQIIEVMATPGRLAMGGEDRVPHLLGSWSENVASWTSRRHPALHVMRYEDMVNDPMTTFGGAMRFLGLPEDEDRLSRAIRFSSFEELSRQEAQTPFIDASAKADRFFRKGRVGGWREELTREQVDAMVSVHRAQMERFGYVPDGF